MKIEKSDIASASSALIAALRSRRINSTSELETVASSSPIFPGQLSSDQVNFKIVGSKKSKPSAVQIHYFTRAAGALVECNVNSRSPHAYIRVRCSYDLDGYESGAVLNGVDNDRYQTKELDTNDFSVVKAELESLSKMR